MNSYQDVDELVARMKEQGKSKTEIIIAAAEAELGWPYVWGAVGAQCTPDKRQYYANRSSCPAAEAALTIKKCQALNGSGKACGGCEWYPGNRRTLIDDCQGFVKQVCSRVGISFSGGGATSMWNGANWTEKGTRATLPENKLCCIFWQASDCKTMNHIGFYYGGMMTHCSGTVKREALSSRVTHWAIPKGLDGTVPTDRPTLRIGSSGDYVVECQNDLLKLGYDLSPYGADGKYGKKTAAQVQKFQEDYDVKPYDGICGRRTWEALDAAIAGGGAKFYTVTIPHVNEAQADALIRQYPGAEKKEEGG